MELSRILGVLYMTTLVTSTRFFHPYDAIGIKDVGNVFNVVDFGATGNGKSDDTQAFLKAWEAVCQATNDPTFNVPQEKTFLLKPLKFEGPCKSQKINVQIMGNIVATNNVGDWSGTEEKKWMAFSDVNGLNVNGNGQIDGQGSVWWKKCGENADCFKPSALHFEDCSNLNLSGLTHTNSQRNHISISSCTNVMISDITITAPETSPNTDGIDISNSTNVQIQNSFIGTGDDCVAINAGSSFINITNVECGPGHGLSVGSLGRKGPKQIDTVEEVHVKHCTFRGTQNGARIKTWKNGAGFARKITFENITLVDTENPILIQQSYCPDCNNADEVSAVKISEVSFIGFQGTSKTEVAINLECSKLEGCTNLVLNHVNITSASGTPTATCSNAHGTSSDTFPPVPCLLP